MKVEIKVPDIGESINEVTLSEWFKEDGDYVELDEPICEFESDKATLELPAEVAGTITRVAGEGDDLPIGAVIATIETDGKPQDITAKEAAPAKEEKAPEPEVVATPEPIVEEKPSYAESHASPAAQKILEEKDVDPKAVKGTGKGGRITREDAEKASPGIKEWAVEKKPESASKKTDPIKYERPDRNFDREERTEKMSRIRRTISKRLVAAKNETAMLTTFNDVDMTRVMEIRKAYKEKFKETHDINLGFMSFFTKASALALKEFPRINAYIEAENIQFHDFVDVSIAVSTPKGLVVPVIRNAESLTMAEIEKEVKRLAILGRDGELTMEDMQGGTFTVSNGGVFGSLLSTPIINQPQSAILGLHRIEDRPVAINGEVVIKPMMYMALSYDHRIVDGKESVSFLVKVKEYIENPERMLYGDDPVKVLLEI
ncbi:MAG: 2-oxoglutarate dehydrogenase complex dihydrolipoyllysine-residue succinyltransferase [Bacteroidetes bacterium]|nr:2-oxoglutarate dehydrogenase complex dihydrolipoyllysine-residue succinyltransferase [Bacteroidota bacterium]